MKYIRFKIIILVSVAVLSTLLVSCKKEPTGQPFTTSSEKNPADSLVRISNLVAATDSINTIQNNNHDSLEKMIKSNRRILIFLLVTSLMLVLLWWFSMQRLKTIKADIYKIMSPKLENIQRLSSDTKDIVKEIQEELRARASTHSQEIPPNKPTRPEPPLDITSITDKLYQMDSKFADIAKIISMQKEQMESSFTGIAHFISEQKKHMDDEAILNLENNEKQDASLKQIETRLGRLDQVVDKILKKVDADSDSRFLTLKTNFPDQFETIKEALLYLEKSDQPQSDAIRKFIRDYSSLLSITSLSRDKERLGVTYQILAELLKGYELILIQPKPDDLFDPNYMDQNLSEGGMGLVATVIYPGFQVGDSIEKALVNVR